MPANRSASHCVVNFGLLLGAIWTGFWVAAWVKWSKKYLSNEDWDGIILTIGVFVNFAVYLAVVVAVWFLRSQNKVMIMVDEVPSWTKIPRDTSHLFAVEDEEEETLDVQLEEMHTKKKPKPTQKKKAPPLPPLPKHIADADLEADLEARVNAVINEKKAVDAVGAVLQSED